MRALAIVSAAFAILALANSVPIKYSLKQKYISGISSYAAPKKTLAWTWRIKFPQLSRLFLFFDKTAVRDDDGEFPWVTTIPPLDKIWEQELSNGGGIHWENNPLDEDADLQDDEDAPVPVSTLIPLSGSHETNLVISDSTQNDEHDVSLPTITPQPQPTYQMPIPSSTPSPPPGPSPSLVTPSSPTPSSTPSMSSSPQPSSSPTPSTSPFSSMSPSVTPSPSLIPIIVQKASDRDYVVISGVKVDRTRVTIVKAT